MNLNQEPDVITVKADELGADENFATIPATCLARLEKHSFQITAGTTSDFEPYRPGERIADGKDDGRILFFVAEGLQQL